MNQALVDDLIVKLQSLFEHPYTSLLLAFLLGDLDKLKNGLDQLKNELVELDASPPKEGQEIIIGNINHFIFNILRDPERIYRGEIQDDLTGLLQAYIVLSADVDYQLGVEILPLIQNHHLKEKKNRFFWLTSRMGFVFLGNENPAVALELLELAVAIGQKIDLDPRKLADVLNNYAIAARMQEKFLDAEIAYKKAIKIRKNLSNVDLDEKNRIARLLTNLAALYSTTGHLDDSEKVLSKALVIRRELAHANSFYNEFYIKTLEDMIVLLGQKGNINQAKNYEKELLEVKEQK